MAYFDLNFNEQNFYSIVISALIEEAKKTGDKIKLNYKQNNHFYDAYFESGISFLEIKEPCLVEIKYSVKVDAVTSGTYFKQLNMLNCSCILITPNYSFIYIVDKEKTLGHPNLLDQLLERNNTAVLSGLLEEKDTFIESGDNDSINISRYANKNETIYHEKHFDYDKPRSVGNIRKEQIDLFSTNYLDEFKTFLQSTDNESKVAVFVGNGASIPFGSDSWSSLINNLVDYLYPHFVEETDNLKQFFSQSTYALSNLTQKTLLSSKETEAKYNEALRYCIYRKYNKLMHQKESILKNLSDAKHKYALQPIFTYNYDTFLEKQYTYDGYGSLRYYCGDESSDYRLHLSAIIHLHGYISYLKNNVKSLILTDEEYYKHYLNTNSWVYKTQEDALKRYVCLFVGSSMSDLFQMSLINNAKITNKKWHCYALLCGENLERKEKVTIMQYYLRRGVKVIFANDYTESLFRTLRDLLCV